MKLNKNDFNTLEEYELACDYELSKDLIKENYGMELTK